MAKAHGESQCLGILTDDGIGILGTLALHCIDLEGLSLIKSVCVYDFFCGMNLVDQETDGCYIL